MKAVGTKVTVSGTQSCVRGRPSVPLCRRTVAARCYQTRAPLNLSRSLSRTQADGVGGVTRGAGTGGRAQAKQKRGAAFATKAIPDDVDWVAVRGYLVSARARARVRVLESEFTLSTSKKYRPFQHFADLPLLFPSSTLQYATVIQFGLIAATLRALDFVFPKIAFEALGKITLFGVDAAAWPAKAKSVAVFFFFLFMSLRSRIFSPLDNRSVFSPSLSFSLLLPGRKRGLPFLPLTATLLFLTKQETHTEFRDKGNARKEETWMDASPPGIPNHLVDNCHS